MNNMSKEYGTALFMLAVQANAAQECADELLMVRDLFCENPEYAEFLASPAVSLSERLSAIESAFGESVSETVLSYLLLLCEKGRIDCFLDSVKEYTALFDASKKITAVKVTSAVELTDDEKTRLAAKLEKKYGGKVDMEFFIDEALLGGLLIEADGKIIDSSLRQRLREVKEVISL